MAIETVDFGIDLGTTNSAIARMTPKGAEIVPVRQQNYLASAVATSKRGEIKVGQEALRADFDPVARWFKRHMGTRNELPLLDGQSRTPQALSAEILKELKAAAKRRYNTDVVDVVITVPAMFTQPQCAATHEAAKLAGLNAVTLLQEPIAAATAYLSEASVDGYYLVYDLGGGTFDVSLVRLHDREMNVVEHGGDNYLGGADFDRRLFEWVLTQIESAGGNVRQFEGGTKRFQLMIACEEARVALSDVETATIYLDDFDLPISKLELSRERLDLVVSSLVTRTIEIARDRLKNRNLSPSDIRSILLVGGPTQMPYVRQRLKDDLGIPLNLDQDPMTVVAKGAAIHAGTMLKQRGRDATSSPPQGTLQLELHFDPVSAEDRTYISGKVVTSEPFRGEVKVSRADGDWDTGWHPLRNGAFSLEVTLGKNVISEYTIHLRDLEGNVQTIEPDTVAIRSGIRTAQPVTPYNYGVVLEGGRTVSTIVKGGLPLPASGSNDELKLATKLVAGSPDELRIYFVEGSSSLAEENVKVGEILVTGGDIRRTVRENERVEIRLRVDESRLISAKLYIPVLDQEFEAQFESALDAPDPEDLTAAVRESKQAIGKIEDLVEDSEQPTLLRASREIEQLEALLDRVEKNEVGEAERVHKQLSDTKAAIRPLLNKYELKASYDNLIQYIGSAEDLCREFRDSMGLAKLEDLRLDAEKCLRLNDLKALEGVRERARDIFWEHYGKTRGCWEYQMEHLRGMANLATDPVTFFEIIRRGEKCVQSNDLEGARLETMRAWELLPSVEKLQNRFFDAGIR